MTASPAGFHAEVPGGTVEGDGDGDGEGDGDGDGDDGDRVDVRTPDGRSLAPTRRYPGEAVTGQFTGQFTGRVTARWCRMQQDAGSAD
ncbi:hypothetical protein [Streptomyces rishiriensis]|uniref:hypothetical protein n=1 Tax=Streptomyces rishiriensis TaxID=68264 RepID=UPI000D58DF89|nr:hypothetical protein [Streptomyces rishiriensis]